MNERLEKEINRRMQYWTEGWKDELGHFNSTTGLHVGGEKATFDDLTELIQHFYNFALQDVREEVIRLNNINKQIAKEKKEGASKWQEGLSAGYADIISFIDNLTK